jgi:hypothetical protein
VKRNPSFWEDLIDENGQEMGNDGTATHDWTREDHEGVLFIDRTMVNRPITNCSILAQDHATSSDHEVLVMAVSADSQEEADNDMIIGWNESAVMEKDGNQKKSYGVS